MSYLHKSHGVTTGLGICSFFAMLFRLNESSPVKLTDEQIALRVKEEYPDRPTADRYLGKNKIRTINEYRCRYNTGMFTKGLSPRKQSHRYNEQGNKVDGKHGRQSVESI